jgi:folylpolyglutamate synthase
MQFPNLLGVARIFAVARFPHQVLGKVLGMNKMMPSRPIDRSYRVNEILYDHVQPQVLTSNAVQSAIDILHSRRRPERPPAEPETDISGLSRIPDAKGTPNLKGTPSILGMKEWLHRIGHSVCLPLCAINL